METNLGNRKTLHFRTQRLFKYGYPVDLPFCFELYHNIPTLKERSDLLARVVVSNSCETTWF